MKRVCFVILFLSCCFYAGCRAKLDTSSSTLRRQTDVIGLELHKLDSLWRSMSERQTLKIEFYRPDMPELYENDPEIEKSQSSRRGTLAAVPGTCLPASLSQQVDETLPVGGGLGAVKSIEISTEKVEGVSSITATDSTYNYMKGDEHARDVSTVSEARQDNGTVATVCIVFAVAALVYLLIKSLLK